MVDVLSLLLTVVPGGMYGRPLTLAKTLLAAVCWSSSLSSTAAAVFLRRLGLG